MNGFPFTLESSRSLEGLCGAYVIRKGEMKGGLKQSTSYKTLYLKTTPKAVRITVNTTLTLMSWKIRQGSSLWNIGVRNLATSSTQRELRCLGWDVPGFAFKLSCLPALWSSSLALALQCFHCEMGILKPTLWAFCGDWDHTCKERGEWQAHRQHLLRLS